jgi:hypothetical protein
VPALAWWRPSVAAIVARPRIIAFATLHLVGACDRLSEQAHGGPLTATSVPVRGTLAVHWVHWEYPLPPHPLDRLDWQLRLAARELRDAADYPNCDTHEGCVATYAQFSLQILSVKMAVRSGSLYRCIRVEEGSMP